MDVNVIFSIILFNILYKYNIVRKRKMRASSEPLPPTSFTPMVVSSKKRKHKENVVDDVLVGYLNIIYSIIEF